MDGRKKCTARLHVGREGADRDTAAGAGDGGGGVMKQRGVSCLFFLFWFMLIRVLCSDVVVFFVIFLARRLLRQLLRVRASTHTHVAVAAAMQQCAFECGK